jgi:hypothetical protein
MLKEPHKMLNRILDAVMFAKNLLENVVFANVPALKDFAAKTCAAVTELAAPFKLLGVESRHDTAQEMSALYKAVIEETDDIAFTRRLVMALYHDANRGDYAKVVADALPHFASLITAYTQQQSAADILAKMAGKPCEDCDEDAASDGSDDL